MKRLVLTLAILAGFALGGVAQNVWKPINIPGTLKGVAANGDLFIGETGILRSQDEGETWQTVLEGAYYNGHDGFTISPKGRIFDLPYNQNHLCISDDGGDTWRNSSDFLYTHFENAPMYAVSDDTLFVYSGDTLLWTLDGGNTWDRTFLSFLDHDSSLGGPWFGTMIADEAGNVYIGTWGWNSDETGVYHANLDNMNEWSLIISDSYVQCMTFDLDGNVVIDCAAIANNGTFYSDQRVDDDYRVLTYSTDHGETYLPIGENLPSTMTVPDTDLKLFKGNDQHLYCHGDVWSGGHITQTQYYKSIRKADRITNHFAPLGAEWYFNLGSFMGSPESYYRMAVEGDTIIQGHQCSVITQQYLGGNGDKQYVYEDNGVVYWYNQTLQAFTTLYDFNANEGDSWVCDIDSCSFEVRVQSVEEVTWEGHTYRVQNIAPIEGEFYYFSIARIIEGIGSVDGLFPYPYACAGDIYDGEYPNFLRCYLVDGEMLYHEGEYDCEEYGYCWDGTIAESYAGGDGTAENPYQIATSQQLALLAQQTNDGTGGDAYYVLTDNLSLEHCPGGTIVDWTPIGMPTITASGSTLDTVLHYFTGHFDGQGHSIYGLRQIIDNGWFEPVGGLFGCTNGAEISNVHMTFCRISGQGEYVGSLVGHAGMTNISNCSLGSSSSIKTELWNGVAGGLVGFAGLPFGSHGTSNESHRIRNCQMGSAVTVEGKAGAGGIVGQVNTESSYTPYEVSNCSTGQYYDYFHIQSETSAGGIVGVMIRGTIRGCRNEYGVFGGGNYGTGGIVGNAQHVTVEGSTNQGEISGAYATGGIVGSGSAYSTYLNVFDCINEGLVIGHNAESGTLAGGIVGFWASKIIRCANKGNVSVTAYHSGAAGGIVGDSFGVVANCYNRGGVTAAMDEDAEEVDWLFAGGIVGAPDARIYNVYNTGIVSGPDLTMFPNTLTGYGNIIGYGTEGCHYLNSYWLDDDDLSACGNVNEPELHGSSAFVQGATSTNWTLNEVQYGTTDLLEALNYGAAIVLDSVPSYPIPTTWLPDTENTNGGFPIIEPLYEPGGLVSFFGSEWYFEIQNENGSITYQYMYQAGDTIVNDEPSHILVKINTLYDKGVHEEVTHEYVYERDGKLYWWNKTLEEFTVLYDFGAETGDSWEIKVGTESLVMHVDAVEDIEYEGRTYRMLHVSDAQDLFSGNIVCGIGHLTSFFPERLMHNGDGIRVEGLRCYWVENELVFKYGDEDCDAIYDELHDVEENGPSTGSGAFAVYPNPTDGVLFVQTLRATSLHNNIFHITNLMGQTLMTGQITAETQRIDVSNLPDGMYFITFAGETRKFVVR